MPCCAKLYNISASVIVPIRCRAHAAQVRAAGCNPCLARLQPVLAEFSSTCRDTKLGRSWPPFGPILPASGATTSKLFRLHPNL